VSERTRDSYADTVRLHLKPALGKVVVQQLTVAQVDAVWKRKRERGYKPNSIRVMRTTLRLALAQAEREGLVVLNVAALSGSLRIRAEEGRSLTVDRARGLRDFLKENWLELVILIALVFGLRRGEPLGLHWDALDFDATTLRVTHGVKRVKNPPGSKRKTRMVVGELKTRRSRRSLFLTTRLVDMLRRHRARQAEDRVAAGSAWQDHGLIFCGGRNSGGPGQLLPHVLADHQEGGPGPLAPARAAPLGRVADARSGHRLVRRLRDSRSLEHRDHEGRLRPPRRGSQG
jgi:integrase